MMSIVKKVTRVFFFLAAFFLLPVVASAATYYMAANGNDANPGTIAAPWASLSKANSVLRPGDALYIRGGTYNGVSLTWTASGSSGNPITVSNYPGETPVFDGNSQAQFVLTNSNTTSYITFRGLEIRNYSYNAFALGYGHHITIQNNYIHDIQAISTGSIYTGAWPDSNAHDIIIEKNRFRSIGRATSPPTWLDHAVYPSLRSSNITIRNNLFEDQRAGAAIHAYDNSGGTIDNLLIYNNIIHVTPGKTIWGILAEDKNIGIYNNTFIIDSGTITTYPRAAVAHHSGTAGDLILRNNIFYGSVPANGYIDSGYYPVTADYNLYYPGGVDSRDTGGHSRTANPQFISASDFHLQEREFNHRGRCFCFSSVGWAFCFRPVSEPVVSAQNPLQARPRFTRRHSFGL